MATRVEVFQITIPRFTLETSPVDTALNFLPGTVDQIQVMIPPGPSGRVGFAIFHSNQQVIPFADGEFVIADGEVLTWPIERYPVNRGWVVRAFNEDAFEHTLFFRLLVTDPLISGRDDGAAAPVTVAGASSVVGLTGETPAVAGGA